jgi:RNA polymerase sigma factor for flagellar operon FliA
MNITNCLLFTARAYNSINNIHFRKMKQSSNARSESILNLKYSEYISNIFGYFILRHEDDNRKDVHSIIIKYTALVRKVAWQIRAKAGSAIELEDLVQIGFVALIEAARKYEDRGVPFASYATIRAKGAMIDHYRKISIASHSTMARRKEFTEAYRKLHTTYGRAPSDREIGDEIGLPPAAVRRIELELDRSRVISLDDAYSDTSIDFAADMLQQDQAIDRTSIQAQLTAAIAALPEREAITLQLIYFEDMSLEEVGMVFNVTAARVCQIKKVALSKIRYRLSELDIICD